MMSKESELDSNSCFWWFEFFVLRRVTF